MTEPRPETVEKEQTKLYLTDAELRRRLGIPDKAFRQVLPELERRGFPKKQPLFGNRRYWPKVKEYLDRMNLLSTDRKSA